MQKKPVPVDCVGCTHDEKGKHALLLTNLLSSTFWQLYFDGAILSLMTLSSDVRILVSHKCPIIGERVVVIFLAYLVTISMVQPANRCGPTHFIVEL